MRRSHVSALEIQFNWKLVTVGIKFRSGKARAKYVVHQIDVRLGIIFWATEFDQNYDVSLL